MVERAGCGVTNSTGLRCLYAGQLRCGAAVYIVTPSVTYSFEQLRCGSGAALWNSMISV
jgi:hypothetical protein